MQASVNVCGQPASWCYECKKIGKNDTGISQCSQPSGICLYPVPKLSLEDTLVFTLFQMCQTQWIHAGTFSSSRRTGIPFSDVVAVARLIGLRLTKRRIRKFLACVNAIVKDDLDAIREAQTVTK